MRRADCASARDCAECSRGRGERRCRRHAPSATAVTNAAIASSIARRSGGVFALARVARASAPRSPLFFEMCLSPSRLSAANVARRSFISAASYAGADSSTAAACASIPIADIACPCAYGEVNSGISASMIVRCIPLSSSFNVGRSMRLPQTSRSCLARSSNSAGSNNSRKGITASDVRRSTKSRIPVRQITAIFALPSTW